MPDPTVAPYGSWKSPITSDLIVSETIGLGQIALDAEDVYWIETRPSEAGRSVAVRRSADGRTTDVTPAPFSARTRVQEYRGGAMLVTDGTVYFSNFADQRLYRHRPGSAPEPLTQAAALRYADGVVDRRRGRIIGVREDHTVAPREAVTTLVSLGLDGESTPGEVLVSSNDFYASPRVSLDGSRLAWLTWSHPNMPWDGSELWVGTFTAAGTVGHAVRVAGGPVESIFQPEWSPDGDLYFVSDREAGDPPKRPREGTTPCTPSSTRSIGTLGSMVSRPSGSTSSRSMRLPLRPDLRRPPSSSAPTTGRAA